MWGAIFVPLFTVLFDFSMIGTTDPGGCRALGDLKQCFRRHLVLMNSSGEYRICIAYFVDKATGTSLEGLPGLPDVFAGTLVGLTYDKRSYYDDLMLKVRHAKRPILIPLT
ncbi:hypothetical protein PRUPE_1G263200 [Prunus persica]|uniref:Uncharacterized protein n=1 Tax=Prunus persica TaxID=3760 RepID=A0A251R3Q0_PRUPE|nr:hypothetical protein PRUPE_1G263200 [Prunus persica]